MKDIYALIFFFLISVTFYAQTTSIPDSNFEQDLIDKGIDSDGIINGEVLTSDISGVTTLEIEYYNISNITGIEGFSSLEILRCEDQNLSQIDLTQNIALKELYLGNPGEIGGNHFESIDLSNAVNLEVLWLQNNYELEYINLKNNANSLLTDVNAECYFEGVNCSKTICIEVDNVNEAQNGNGVYANWVIPSSNYSENCSLSTKNIQKSTNIQIFPNPTTQSFKIQNQNYVTIKSVEIYTVSGRKILSFNENTIYDISQLSNGIYIVKVKTPETESLHKIIKK